MGWFEVAQIGLSSSAARAATEVVSKSPVSIGTSLSGAEDGAHDPIPVASVATPVKDCATAAMVSIDRLVLLFEWVLPRARR
jgi:hypothetical protein